MRLRCFLISILRCLVPLGLLTLVACSRGETATADFETRFPVRVGDQTVRVQVAILPAEMRRGLMFRESLEADEGMIFLFRQPGQQSFWMRNTPLPLDIGYFTSDGMLEEVLPLHPHSENAVRSSSDRIQIALELNRGWFRTNGIRPGAQMNLHDVNDAIRQRGFQPADFNLRPPAFLP
jgi:uncharacterized membrane protein (UPF0127 family)